MALRLEVWVSPISGLIGSILNGSGKLSPLMSTSDLVFPYCLKVLIGRKRSALTLLVICCLAACSASNPTEPSSYDLPYSPVDLLVTQEEQIALTQWCDENSTLKDLDCEKEVARVALKVGFRDSRGDEKCWVELFADRVLGKFSLDEGAYESRSHSCVELGLTRMDN